MLRVIKLIILLSVFPLYGKSICQNVQSIVTEKSLKQGKVTKKVINVEIEPIWSIHGGYYPNIFVNEKATQGVLEFNKDGKTEKVNFNFISNKKGSISQNLQLKNLMLDWISRYPADVLLSIKNKKKIVCIKKYKIIGGD